MENYEIIERLGAGGYGEVHKVRDVRTNKEYAMKLMLSENCLESFKNEIRFLIEARSNFNPYVVRYISSFTVENPPQFAIITEYCSGGDLRSIIQKYKKQEVLIPEETIIKCISQIAVGMAFLHERKILHRDIKPGNILIDPEGNLKLSDLGVSRQLAGKTHTTTGPGTPCYTSPEALESGRHSYSSDVWAFGCTLHELCCLSFAFEEDSYAGLLKEMKMGYDGSRIPKCYDPRIREIITSMLSVDIKLRPTCEELLNNRLIKDYIGPVIVGNIETQTYENGDRFQGELKNGKRNGKGAYFYADGSVYKGDWKDGKENGEGMLTTSYGDEYDGEWKSGKKHGKGTYTFANGSKYVGEFRNDCMEGAGTLHFPDGGKYEGSWKQDREHGKGRRTYKDGGLYDGMWKNGLRHGEGIRVYADRRFEGMWEKDVKKGLGAWYLNDGTVISGRWYGNCSNSGCNLF